MDNSEEFGGWTGCYDRNGHPIGREEWQELFSLPGYRRIAHTVLPDGRYVSTVWLGLEHGADEQGRPLIFESMAFAAEVTRIELFPDREFHRDIGMERYVTEEEAGAGHARMVARITTEA